jgi:hypothetical protein
MQEGGQLRRDAVDGARQDSDDRVDQATDDGKTHEKHFAFEGPMVEGAAYRPQQPSYSSKTKLANNF